MDERNNLYLENEKLVPYVVIKMIHISPNDVDFDDIMQVGRIALWKATNRYNDNIEVAFSTFAVKFIENKILTFLQSKGEHEYRSHRMNDISLDDEDNNLDNELASDLMNPDDEILFNHIKELKNDSPQSQCLWLMYEGYSCNEIAKMLNISEATVRTYNCNEKKRIKKIIG